MKKLNVSIIGAAGYTGGELLRILVHHPHCELVCVHSNSQKGKKVSDVHPDLIGDCELIFTDHVPKEEIDAVFIGDTTDIYFGVEGSVSYSIFNFFRPYRSDHFWS